MGSATSTMPEIIVTKRDFGRLNNLISNYAPIISWDAVRFLLGELHRARLVDVDAIPPTNVTMNSQVEIRDMRTGDTRIATLTYPNEQGQYRDALSVLTPLGSALLGLSKSQAISYVDTDGHEKTVEVLRILHQPEAHYRFKATSRVDQFSEPGTALTQSAAGVISVRKRHTCPAG